MLCFCQFSSCGQWKRTQSEGIGKGYGLAFVQQISEGGHVGGWCAGLASAMNMCVWLNICVRYQMSVWAVD